MIRFGRAARFLSGIPHPHLLGVCRPTLGLLESRHHFFSICVTVIEATRTFSRSVSPSHLVRARTTARLFSRRQSARRPSRQPKITTSAVEKASASLCGGASLLSPQFWVGFQNVSNQMAGAGNPYAQVFHPGGTRHRRNTCWHTRSIFRCSSYINVQWLIPRVRLLWFNGAFDVPALMFSDRFAQWSVRYRPGRPHVRPPAIRRWRDCSTSCASR